MNNISELHPQESNSFHFFQFAYQKAQENGLKGSVKNTRHGTITGVLQGPKDKVANM